MRYRLQIPGLLLLVAFGLIGWTAACRPAVANAPSAQTQAYTFYLYPWSEDNPDNRLIPLDPETLADQPEGATMDLGRAWRLSSDGSTLVNVESPAGRASLDLEDSWIVVYDFQNGTERNRFHPPARGLIADLSADGARLLLQADADPYTQSSYPPTVEWYVIDTAGGELLAQVEDADEACFRQRTYSDPAGQRIYCLVDPAVTTANEPEPMQIVAYDVESGLRAGRLDLPQVLLGGEEIELDGRPSSTPARTRLRWLTPTPSAWRKPLPCSAIRIYGIGLGLPRRLPAPKGKCRALSARPSLVLTGNPFTFSLKKCG